MFEKIVETLNNTGKTVSEKTKQGSDIVKANIKISSEERALNDVYLEIGKTYYEKNAENPCCDTMKELFGMVAEKKASIAALKQQIRTIKGVSVCEACGAENPVENEFCGKCGAKIEKPAPAEETPAEETPAEEINVEVVPDEDASESSDSE